MNSWLLFLLLLNLYLLCVFLLVRSGKMTKWNLSLFGPALMLKTQRGRGILDWFARARGFFDRLAGFGIWMTGVIMALMTLLLIIQVYFVAKIPASQAPPLSYALGIPGINPLIPVGFGILALIFAVVVHEFGHGILARVHNLKVKTMGILLFIVPVGAFVEPDEEELKQAKRKVRVKVFAAGVTVNLLFALVFALLFSGALFAGVHARDGVPIEGVEKDSPALDAGLEPGMLIHKVNERVVPNRDEFTRAMQNVTPGDSVLLTMTPDPSVFQVRTKSCTDLYTRPAQDGEPARDGRTYCREVLGVEDPDNRTMIGISVYPSQFVAQTLANPLPPCVDRRECWGPLVYYIALPFDAIQGTFSLSGVYQDFYEVPFHPGTFWFLANLVYWLFWINLMLGLTNALPIVPLDGGYMFRDFVAKVVGSQRERAVRNISVGTALFLLSLVILQFVLPRIMGFFQ